ncbi:MAG: hypothetical protein ABSA93_01965 [Streptosporangiaceae bacterium]|jgi:hypothetical protein
MGIFAKRRAAPAPAVPFPPAEAWRPLIDLLAAPLPEPQRSSRWPAFLAGVEEEGLDQDTGEARHHGHENVLITVLQDTSEWNWWLALYVDWKDPQTAVDQAEVIARTHGLTETFTWDWAARPDAEVDEVLEVFGQWIGDRGLSFVPWERGQDAYFGFVIRPDQVDEWTALTGSLRLETP